MTDDELEFSLDVLRELSVKAFNSGNRSDARRLRFILNALLKERAARFDQRGEKGRSPVLPTQDLPAPINLVGGHHE